MFSCALAAAMLLADAGWAEPLQKIPYVLRPGPPREAPDGAVRAACAKDFRTFCGNVQPGGGRIGDCIAAHLDALEPTCRAAIGGSGLAVNSGKGGEPTRSAQWPCVQDAKSFCPKVPPEQAPIIRCLEQHLGELQPTCQSTVESARMRQRSL
jgi:hypothetical protein